MKFGFSWRSRFVEFENTHIIFLGSLLHKIMQLYMSLYFQQMRVVPNEKVFGRGICGFLHVCIHFKPVDPNIHMCNKQVNRHTKEKYSCQCHIMSQE